MQNSDKPLCGMNNSRLKNEKPTNKEGTAAWTDSEHHDSDTNVNIPSENNVENAKQWVDNGSRL